MKVLMLGYDRGMLADGLIGDVVSRHQHYADTCGSIDVVIFASSRFGDREWSKNLRAFSTKSAKVFHWRNAVRKARVLCKENRYDLVVTPEFAAPAGAKIAHEFGIPWVVSVHSMFFSRDWLGFDLLRWFLYLVVKMSIRSADGFRVVNKTIKEKILDWGLIKPILLQPTPVNTKKFMVFDKPTNQIPIILYAGRLSQEKNVGMLIKAVKKIKDNLELKVVGTGPQEKKLKRLALNDKRIVFLGGRTYDELPTIYRGTDIFVLPSSTESFGKVLVEAAAAKCAIISTKTIGAESIIKDSNNGILVPVGDEREMKQAIERLLKDEALRERLAENAKNATKDYDFEIATKNVVEFWREIVNKNVLN